MSSLTVNDGVRLAGGAGNLAAIQSPIQQLARLTCAALLWQNVAYENGESNAAEIVNLVHKCKPNEVANLAVHIRVEQGIRSTALFLLAELFKVPQAAVFAGNALRECILRPDDATEFLKLYWRAGKQPIAAQAKKALAHALSKFDEYQLGKYKSGTGNIKLRDVMFLVHAKPRDKNKEKLFSKLANNKLETPETREVLLSAARTTGEKRQAFETLLGNNKMPAQALLMNLRIMESVGVSKQTISNAIINANPDRISAIKFFNAKREAPLFSSELEHLMLKSLGKYPKLPGKTVFVVDCSGSMRTHISSKSTSTRLDIAYTLAVMAREICEEVIIYLTAGDDWKSGHKTARVAQSPRGWGLLESMTRISPSLGGGGIFTRQCIEYIKGDLGAEAASVDRILVFSDSQDCDTDSKKKPAPFGKTNYIIDVGAHRHGINYAGVWTAEISGWSPNFLSYIAQTEGVLSITYDTYDFSKKQVSLTKPSDKVDVIQYSLLDDVE